VPPKKRACPERSSQKAAISPARRRKVPDSKPTELDRKKEKPGTEARPGSVAGQGPEAACFPPDPFRENRMSEEIAAVRKATDRDARDLALFNHRVRHLLSQLPASPGGEAADLPDGLDESGELRATIQCVLADHLEPAVRALQAAARAGDNPPC
jgi:hypothetical protein